MDNLYNFLNNFRAGIANADREVNNLLNQAGQGMANAWKAGTAPMVDAGQQIGNALNQYGQMFMVPFQAAGQQLSNLGNQAGQAIANLVGQQNNQAQPAQTTAQPTATTATATPTTQTTPTNNTGVTYYYRDPGIDTFVNTLRFLYNPLRGITGWTPLDAVADQTGNILYGAFGKQYVAPEEVKEEVKEEAKEEDKKEEAKTEDEDMITYTYKPGDTFGQVIKDLGLGTGMGLWGTGGDVEYYTKQLVDQGIWPTNIPGNIPIGTTIKLKRRKI